MAMLGESYQECAGFSQEYRLAQLERDRLKLIAALKQMRADAENNGHGYIVSQVDAALSAVGAS
jgi:hypothetical protein